MQDVQPRGLRRAAAAAYVGVSASHFDKERAAGNVPAPKMVLGVALWDRHDLDLLFDGMPVVAANDNVPANEWDQHWQSTESRNT